jgi:hypothetical protein
MWVAAAAKVGVLKDPPSPASEIQSERKLANSSSSHATQIADIATRRWGRGGKRKGGMRI